MQSIIIPPPRVVGNVTPSKVVAVHTKLSSSDAIGQPAADWMQTSAECVVVVTPFVKSTVNVMQQLPLPAVQTAEDTTALPGRLLVADAASHEIPANVNLAPPELQCEHSTMQGTGHGPGVQVPPEVVQLVWLTFGVNVPGGYSQHPYSSSQQM